MKDERLAIHCYLLGLVLTFKLFHCLTSFFFPCDVVLLLFFAFFGIIHLFFAGLGITTFLLKYFVIKNKQRPASNCQRFHDFF